ncbi:hypothetical protein D3C78_1610910 [compost metagenome]
MSSLILTALPSCCWVAAVPSSLAPAKRAACCTRPEASTGPGWVMALPWPPPQAKGWPMKRRACATKDSAVALGAAGLVTGAAGFAGVAVWVGAVGLAGVKTGLNSEPMGRKV